MVVIPSNDRSWGVSVTGGLTSCDRQSNLLSSSNNSICSRSVQSSALVCRPKKVLTKGSSMLSRVEKYKLRYRMFGGRGVHRPPNCLVFLLIVHRSLVLTIGIKNHIIMGFVPVAGGVLVGVASGVMALSGGDAVRSADHVSVLCVVTSGGALARVLVLPGAWNSMCRRSRVRRSSPAKKMIGMCCRRRNGGRGGMWRCPMATSSENMTKIVGCVWRGCMLRSSCRAWKP